jgi:hypothetical protein
MVTRRDVIAMGTSLTAIALTRVERVAAQAPNVRTRQDVSKLTATSPDIVALRDGIQKMRNLPPADRRSLIAQSKIHGDIGGDFRHCQHGNWWFGPWHRAYLFYFEEIIRKLAGAEDFALPYWDWSKDFKLPALFWGAGNSLDNPARPGQSGSGRRVSAMSAITTADQSRYVNRTVISRILQTPDFESFGGSEVAMLGDSAGQGQLEETPHNFIHRWVGGDMVTAGSSFDPIFWLHHCNIDRLWVEWVQRHSNGMPNSSTWLDTPFANHFCDREGNLISTNTATTPITTRQLLDTTKLGYQYDTRPNPSAFRLSAPLQPVATPASASSPSLQDRAANFTLPVQSSFVDAVRNTVLSGNRGALRLTLRGVKIPKDPNIGLDIHVNCLKAPRDLTANDPSHVTTVTFFHEQHSGHQEGLTFLADMRPAIATLYADRVLPADEPLKVTIVARSLFGEAEMLDATEISPSHVSLQVVAPPQ